MNTDAIRVIDCAGIRLIRGKYWDRSADFTGSCVKESDAELLYESSVSYTEILMTF